MDCGNDFSYAHARGWWISTTSICKPDMCVRFFKALSMYFTGTLNELVATIMGSFLTGNLGTHTFAILLFVSIPLH